MNYPSLWAYAEAVVTVPRGVHRDLDGDHSSGCRCLDAEVGVLREPGISGGTPSRAAQEEAVWSGVSLFVVPGADEGVEFVQEIERVWKELTD